MHFKAADAPVTRLAADALEGAWRQETETVGSSSGRGSGGGFANDLRAPVITLQETRSRGDRDVPIILRDGAIYDRELDRFFRDLPANGARSRHTLRAYGYDIMLWVRFLSDARGKTVWRADRDDVLAYMSFPREHWAQIASTNPLERVNREVKRRSDVVGIFPNDEAIIRLVGALMLETNDEWAVARRYMSLETLARVTDNPTVRLPAVAT